MCLESTPRPRALRSVLGADSSSRGRMMAILKTDPPQTTGTHNLARSLTQEPKASPSLKYIAAGFIFGHGPSSLSWLPRSNISPFELHEARGDSTPSSNDTDNDHSLSQLFVHQALTCPKGQSAWPWPLPVWRRKLAQCKIKVFRSDLLPLDMKWSCICAGRRCGSLKMNVS